MNSHKSPSGVIGDFVDGERFKNSPLFAEDNCALQIQLYYDELELCNPLGSKAKKHKIGVNLILVSACVFIYVCFYSGLTYYTLGNLHPELRSALCSIQLVSIAKYTTVEKCGYNKLLEPLVDAVLKLEQVCVPDFCFFVFTPHMCRKKVFCSSWIMGTSCVYVALLQHFLRIILLPGVSLGSRL